MAEGDVGILTAIWRFFTFYNLRKGRRILDAANRQFTGSAEGIADAVDIQRDRMVREFRTLRDAISQLESQIELKRENLERCTDQEEKLNEQREGAVELADQAEKKGDTAEFEKWSKNYEDYDNKIKDLDAREAELEADIAKLEESSRRYMVQLTDFQRQIEGLSEEKAALVADFVSSQAIIALNERLLGIQTSFDQGPMDAVRKRVRDLKSEAKITEKLAGTDSRMQDMEAARAGRMAASKSKLSDVLAERRAKVSAAQKAEQVGEVSPESHTKVGETQERPRV